MSQHSRRAELFGVEAEEFLADLELLTQARELADPERLVRGARSLRGAAMFAGFGSYARAAAALEALARQLRSGAMEWDASTREELTDAVATLRGLLPHGTGWDATADREALALAERLERFGGGGARRAANAPAALTSGVRAFIARESALIAGSLERAARALSPLPPAEALASVLERMRSLRGLGASADLSPLPEMLDAMEIATRTLLGDDPPPPDVAEVFEEAARALAAMATEIAETGRIVAPPELDRVALHLLSAYAEERDVVDISFLAPDGEASVVTQSPSWSVLPDALPVPIEMVGVGDHLLLMADTLARPTIPVVRDLRLFVLHRTLATMPHRSATAHFLQPITEAITGAIAHRIASRQLDRFIKILRDCGRFLIDSGSSQQLVALLKDRDHLVGQILKGELGLALAPSQHHPPLAGEVTVDRIDDARPDVAKIVAQESLAPSRPLVDHELPMVFSDVREHDSVSLDDFQWDIKPMEAIIPDLDMMRREREAAEANARSSRALAPEQGAPAPTAPESPVQEQGAATAEEEVVPVQEAVSVQEPVQQQGFPPVQEAVPVSEIAPVAAAVPEQPLEAAEVYAMLEVEAPDAPETVNPEVPEGAAPTEPEPVATANQGELDSELPIVDIETLLEGDSELAVVPINTLLENEMDDLIGTPIVPIEALMFESERAHIGLVPNVAPGTPTRLEEAMQRQRVLMASEPTPEPSLEGLFGQEVIPIATILYRGNAALIRAEEIRATIAKKLNAPTVSLDFIRPEVEELLDLVALARDAA